MRKVVVAVKEPPSVFCGGCRTWIVSNESPAIFAKADGAARKVLVWKCPACRGEAAPEEVEVDRGPVTGADISKDERLGPYRQVKRDTVKLNASGKTARADLECGHNVCVLPDATQARCKKCRAGKAST